MPFFFVYGALLELAMIKWTVNGHNFYKTYTRKQVEEEAWKQIEREKLREKVFAQLKYQK